MLLLPARHMLDGFGKLLLQRLDDVFDPLAFLLGELVEFVRLQHVAVMHGSEREACGCAEQRNLLRLGLCAQLLEGLFLLLLIFLVDRLAAVLIFLALDDRRDRDLEVVDQARHALLQRAAGAGAEFERDRLVRRAEIVDINPVGGRALLERDTGEEAQDGLVLARTVLTQHEDVVALAADASAEAERLQHALLPHEARMIAKLDRGLERELAHIAGAIKHLGRNRFNSHIRPVSAALPQAFLMRRL